jgi:hypothetical protein
MARRKREKTPLNTAKRKREQLRWTPHNVKAGVSAFKKRMRAQYSRRETTRWLRSIIQESK